MSHPRMATKEAGELFVDPHRVFAHWVPDTEIGPGCPPVDPTGGPVPVELTV